MDATSASHGRLDYTRVCVELDASKPIIQQAKIYKSTSQPYSMKAEFEWLPLYCQDCKVFGHSPSNCSSKPKMRSENRVSEGALAQSSEWRVVVKNKSKGKAIAVDTGTSGTRNMAETSSPQKASEPHVACIDLKTLVRQSQDLGHSTGNVRLLSSNVDQDVTPIQAQNTMDVNTLSPLASPILPLLAAFGGDRNASQVADKGGTKQLKSL